MTRHQPRLDLPNPTVRSVHPRRSWIGRNAFSDRVAAVRSVSGDQSAARRAPSLLCRSIYIPRSGLDGLKRNGTVDYRPLDLDRTDQIWSLKPRRQHSQRLVSVHVSASVYLDFSILFLIGKLQISPCNENNHNFLTTTPNLIIFIYLEISWHVEYFGSDKIQIWLSIKYSNFKWWIWVYL